MTQKTEIQCIDFRISKFKWSHVAPLSDGGKMVANGGKMVANGGKMVANGGKWWQIILILLIDCCLSYRYFIILFKKIWHVSSQFFRVPPIAPVYQIGANRILKLSDDARINKDMGSVDSMWHVAGNDSQCHIWFGVFLLASVDYIEANGILKRFNDTRTHENLRGADSMWHMIGKDLWCHIWHQLRCGEARKEVKWSLGSIKRLMWDGEGMG